MPFAYHCRSMAVSSQIAHKSASERLKPQPLRCHRRGGLRRSVTHLGVMRSNESGLLQVIAEARRLGFYSVRGNHDDKALAAYEAFKANKPVPAKTRWAQALPSLFSTRLKADCSRGRIIIGHTGWSG